MSVVYLIVLLVSLGCMVLIDRRFRLFFWHRPGLACLVLGAGLVFFVAWDLFGIAWGVFARGDSAFSTGWMLAPGLPVEELFFLTFLGYLTMILVTGANRLTAAVRHR